MKTFKAGLIEVMAHDYYRRESDKGQMHISFKDYENPMWDPFLKKLKSEGWRTPTKKEAQYLNSLHIMRNPIGDFSDKFPPYSNYLIVDKGASYSEYAKPVVRVFNFRDGKIYTYNMDSLAMLRLVRTI